MITCNLCGKEFSDYTCGFGKHLKTIHNITSKEYYDKYFKQEDEGYCIVCGKPTAFRSINVGYSKCCSIKCVNKSEIHKEKIRQTKLERYDDENYNNREKSTETMLSRYNCSHNFSGELRKKEIETWKRKYGVDNPWKNKDIIKKCKETFAKNHNGYLSPFQIPEIKIKLEKLANSPEAKRKANATKEKNNNRSKAEIYFRDELLKLNINFEEEYYSEKYPYLCDFYIPDLDMYIELHIYWTHGGHKYNKNNKDDLEKVKLWESKNKKIYSDAIYIWTISDIQKYNKAKRNKLNYVVLYNMNEINNFINQLKELII